MIQQLEVLRAAAGQDIAEAQSLEELREIRVRYLGKKGELTRILKGLGALTPEERPIAGQRANTAREEIEGLLDAWSKHYAALPGLEQAVVGLACAHHRLLWIHPFRDGNGRAARLHSHLVLHALGMTQGLWSPMRGLARRQGDYYARLNNADLPRRHDYDGRGALSQEELIAFAGFFLETCQNQASFMAAKLNLAGLRERIADLLRWLAAHPWQVGSEKSVVKPEALEAVHYVAMAGPVERDRFMAMTGLPERTARRVLASLLDWGLLNAASSRGLGSAPVVPPGKSTATTLKSYAAAK